MTPPLGLQHALSALIGDAQLVPCPLPGTALSLWLLDADNMDRAFSQEETRRILHEPHYWSFCWAIGMALARYLAAHPEWVVGKRVLDFGAGSGVAGIAAVKAGALEVVACDLDPLALAACRANAELNQVALSYSADFFAEADRFDLILVADVLYDRANLPLLDQFLTRGREALVADSRVSGSAVSRASESAVVFAAVVSACATSSSGRQSTVIPTSDSISPSACAFARAAWIADIGARSYNRSNMDAAGNDGHPGGPIRATLPPS